MCTSVGNRCAVCKANTEASEKASSSSTSLRPLPQGCAIPRDPTTCTLHVAGCFVSPRPCMQTSHPVIHTTF
ncbi:hypothetical protein K439DRAFT_1637338, partial [Ramaria rubella]